MRNGKKIYPIAIFIILSLTAALAYMNFFQVKALKTESNILKAQLKDLQVQNKTLKEKNNSLNKNKLDIEQKINSLTLNN